MATTGARIYSIDLARGIAVLLMILVHSLETLANSDVRHSVFGDVIDFLGGPPAAPVFMALMGASLFFSRKSGLWLGIKRGLYIIALGYVLNFARGVVPIWLAEWLRPASLTALPAEVKDTYVAFIDLDILQFAGLALIVMAVLRALKINRYVLLGLAAVIAIVSPMLWGYHTGIVPLDFALDYLWGDIPAKVEFIGNLICFPFFPWFAYVLLGMFLGETLSTSSNPGRIFRISGLVGAALLLLGLIMSSADFDYQWGDYYHHRGWMVTFICGLILVWLCICQWLVEWIPANRVFELFYGWSRNVNRIYMIQWILILWSAIFYLGINQCNLPQTLAIMTGLIVATHLLNLLILWIKKKTASPK